MNYLLKFFEIEGNSRQLTKAKTLAWQLAGLLFLLFLLLVEEIYISYGKFDTRIIKVILIFHLFIVMYGVKKNKFQRIKGKILKQSIIYLFSIIGVLVCITTLAYVQQI